ncbi:DUF6446 family protein [Thalassococcus sp. S3]|uniref:DUF6446 family protein n=1 Tax=Thalassococcus sp. S3 TaxID=2017482 RepID=UPI0010242D57|nr:DUF6446 family protein [Thalassococcus sp. S3]QBF32716.1 histidine kinase [Thalassococcus sp. S3]
MSGKIVGIVLILSGLIAGASLYYLQVYGFYDEVAETDGPDVQLVSVVSGQPEPIIYDSFEAIDADSSPIRYRACFTTTASHAMLSETYVGLDDVTPRNAPGWFDCFEAESIAAELDAGTALAFLGEKNVRYGVDRIVAITDDGRGYVWHELNDCGEKAYDGTVVGEDCPPRPDTSQ